MDTKTTHQQEMVTAHEHTDKAKSEGLISRDEMKRHIDNFLQDSRADHKVREVMLGDDSKLEGWYKLLLMYGKPTCGSARGMPPESLD